MAQNVKKLLESDFRKACESEFQNLYITSSEASYLEESTRLQPQSKLWFDYRAGQITASKFSAISKASLNPPPASLVKEIMGEKGVNVQDVPALDWGKMEEDSARKEYLKKAEEIHVTFNY